MARTKQTKQQRLLFGDRAPRKRMDLIEKISQRVITDAEEKGSVPDGSESDDFLFGTSSEEDTPGSPEVAEENASASPEVAEENASASAELAKENASSEEDSPASPEVAEGNASPEVAEGNASSEVAEGNASSEDASSEDASPEVAEEKNAEVVGQNIPQEFYFNKPGYGECRL